MHIPLCSRRLLYCHNGRHDQQLIQRLSQAAKFAPRFSIGVQIRHSWFEPCARARSVPPLPARGGDRKWRHTYRAQLRPFIPETQSSISVSSLALGLAASVLGVYVWNWYNSKTRVPPSSENYNPDTEDVPRDRVCPGMNADIPPGRPGNLTFTQEAKLRDLWEALFKLTDTYGASSSQGFPPDSPPSRLSTSESPDNAARKPKRFGSLLRRKGKNDEAILSDTASTTESITSSIPADDKHGLGKDFRLALASQTPEQLRDKLREFTKADDPDAVLLRYLRARKWDVQAALIMLIATIHWRADVMHLDDDIMRQGEPGAILSAKGKSVPGMDEKLGKEFMQQLTMGKSFLHGVDKEGRPICYVRVRLHRGGDQSVQALERYIVWTIETARLLLRPPVDTAVIIFDMTSFSMANMDYTPVKFMIKCFEANYPESLGAVLVHKSPWLFSSIWAIIKGWLDPVVASKVHFTKDAKDLAQYIPKGNIPKDIGGDEDWTYEYTEPQEEAIMDSRLGDEKGLAPLMAQRQALFAEFEKQTLKWCTEESSREESARKRRELSQKLTQSYWQIDPYLRAKTLYDRAGMIKPGGVIDFYPERAQKGPLEYRGIDTLESNGETPGRPSVDSVDGKSIYYDAPEGLSI